MTYLAIICALLVGALIAQGIRHDRETEAREDAWRAERSQLLNRIQAPEIAVVPEGEPVAYVAPDDDEGYWAYAEEREAA